MVSPFSDIPPFFFLDIDFWLFVGFAFVVYILSGLIGELWHKLTKKRGRNGDRC